ncbi:hypothetical protein B0H65DRAFT_428337 [Neurospora tetraspora]|uniref:Uncharacterized protein n=1 Tax=Neurospora tetraspora TaxID=94610 RepID=A0AAE0MR96_9PEZI|nr:hypothetical protein B0H65DRAFT_428337 [Neurospora tetraspora]
MSSVLTRQYERDIGIYALDSNPMIAQVGKMAEQLLWQINWKSSRDNLVSTIYFNVVRLVSYVEYGLTFDLQKEKEELEETISKAS